MPHVEIIRPSELSESRRALWARLLDSRPVVSPLLHPDFTDLVAGSRPDVRIACATDRQGHRAFLPFHKRPLGLARPIGSTFSDYHALIAEPDFSESLETILHAAGLRGYRYFALLDGDGDGDRGYRVTVDADKDPLAIFQANHPRRAKAFRRLRRKLERDHGRIELILDDRRKSTFDALLGWKTQQFAATGRHNVLKPRWASRLLSRLHARGHGLVGGYLVSLCVDGTPVAAEFGPRLGGIFHPWLAAYDDQYDRYSPGHLLVHGFIQSMPVAGVTAYDLGTGDDPHKIMFATESFQVSAGFAYPARPRWRAEWLQPGAGGLAGKVARRWEQIILSETGLMGRLGGAATAANRLISRKV
mgnify:CR=1 FL=1|tara:strand:+ start:183 stop:1262 length:1080 start_codon:yes stop_codon:yes gene_type:complete